MYPARLPNCYLELFMREDMCKVIVERPSRGKPADQSSTREIKAHWLLR
jgi:hypothetical protein